MSTVGVSTRGITASLERTTARATIVDASLSSLASLGASIGSEPQPVSHATNPQGMQPDRTRAKSEMRVMKDRLRKGYSSFKLKPRKNAST
jgi:hypothetical protein